MLTHLLVLAEAEAVQDLQGVMPPQRLAARRGAFLPCFDGEFDKFLQPFRIQLENMIFVQTVITSFSFALLYGTITIYYKQ